MESIRVTSTRSFLGQWPPLPRIFLNVRQSLSDPFFPSQKDVESKPISLNHESLDSRFSRILFGIFPKTLLSHRETWLGSVTARLSDISEGSRAVSVTHWEFLGDSLRSH